MNPETPYDTIAAAEAELTTAGYKRDVQRAMWINGNSQARVVRNPVTNKFHIFSK